MSQLETEEKTTRIAVTGATLADALEGAAEWARSTAADGLIVEALAHDGGIDTPEHTIRLYVRPRPERRGLPE